MSLGEKNTKTWVLRNYLGFSAPQSVCTVCGANTAILLCSVIGHGKLSRFLDVWYKVYLWKS